MFWSFLFKTKPDQAFPSHVQMSNFSPQLSILVIILIYQYIFLGHHVHKDKEKQNTYQTTYQDWQKQWKQASEGRCQILFHGFVLKNYGNLRKVRRFDPRQIQTVSKMVQSRPKDASKLNPTCCKDVPKVFIPNTVTNTKLIWLFLISIAVHNKDKYKDKRINIPCFHLVFTLAFFGRYPEKASQ